MNHTSPEKISPFEAHQRGRHMIVGIAIAAVATLAAGIVGTEITHNPEVLEAVATADILVVSGLAVMADRRNSRNIERSRG